MIALKTRLAGVRIWVMYLVSYMLDRCQPTMELLINLKLFVLGCVVQGQRSLLEARPGRSPIVEVPTNNFWNRFGRRQQVGISQVLTDGVQIQELMNRCAL